jgi:ABC-type dipeptide/oligopeptide/nickel transport system permease subunit
MASKKVYIIKRFLMLLLVVFGVLIITFVITRVIPAHPEFLWAGPHPTKEQLEKARETLHLNDPIHVQLYYYLSDFLQGNWGISWRTRTPVIIDIQSARAHIFGTDETGRDMFSRIILGARFSLIIAVSVIALALLIGVPIGIISGYSSSFICARAHFRV